MKTKRFLSILLIVALMISATSGVVFAKQSYDTGVIDFEGYKGNWDATTNPTNITLPTHSSATFGKTGDTAPNASNGVTNGAPEGDTDNGNSIKVYYKYNSTLSSNYSGFQIHLNDTFENTFRVKFSLYYKQSLGGDYVYFKDGTYNSRAVYITNGRKVCFFWNDYVEDSSGNGITLELDKWYDFDILYNINNEEFRAVISDDSGIISDTTAVNAESNALSKLTRIDFRSYSPLGNSGNNKNTGVAEYYVDNLRVSSDWKYKNSSDSATTNKDVEVFDFTNTPVSNSKLDITGNIGKLYTNVNADTATDTAKGTVLDFTAATSSNAVFYDITEPAERSFFYSIDFKLNDFNFKDIRFRHNYDGGKLTGGDATFQITSAKAVNMLGQRVKADGTTGGANYEISSGKWYTFAMEYDVNTGIAIVSLIDGNTVYSYTRDCGDIGIELSQVKIFCNFETGASPSSILFDNMKFRYTRSEEYPSFDISANSSATIAVPFINSKFHVSADITTKDTADTTVVATGGTADVTLAAVGNDASVHKISAVVNDTSAASIVFNAGGDITVDNLKLETVYDFELIESKSTTGAEQLLYEDSAAKASFTNKIDKTSFTTSTVTMPCIDEVPEYTITFPDDYTAQINFANGLDFGTHYHIAFTGIRDIYGNTLTDYIEFDTYQPDLVMTNPSFTRDGELLSLTSPGKITSTITAQAFNGCTYDMMFTLALYCAGELKSVDTKSFTIGAAEASHSVEVTVPGDGNFYVAKAFVWDESLSPYTQTAILKATTDQPVAILKFDDLKSQKIDDFNEVTQWLDEQDIKASYGFMGYQLLDNVSSTIRNEVDATILSMYRNPRIELWYHGYADTNMYKDKTEAEQKSDFDSGINGAYEKYGITFTAFNPPSNNLDETTLNLINDTYTNFTTVMLKDKPLSSLGYDDADYSFTTLWKAIDMESNDTLLSLDTLKASWEEAKTNGYEYVLMQMHPGYTWNKLTTDSSTEYGKDTLTQFVNYLKSQGVVFMTPSEYTEYSQSLS